jgi:hypothetical protein
MIASKMRAFFGSLLVLKVDYLVVSNGLRHYCCRIDYARNTYYFLPDIPRYADL